MLRENRSFGSSDSVIKAKCVQITGST